MSSRIAESFLRDAIQKGAFAIVVEFHRGGIIKPTKASAIWIRLEQVDRRLVLEVQDTGIGMPAAPNSGKGAGLRLMEHCCAMSGGNFSIEPRSDGGICIACSVLRTGDHR